MNTIPKTGKWNEISEIIENNFAHIETQLLQLENASVYNKGVHASVESLQQSYPSPMVGSFAYVGTTTPYAIYTYSSTGWSNSGATGAPIEVDYSSLEIATESASGLMSSAHVQNLNSLILQTSTLESSVTTLSGTVGTQGQDIVSLQQSRKGFQTNIESLKTSTAEISNKVNTLEPRVTTLAGKVSSIDDYIEDYIKPVDAVFPAFIHLGEFNTSSDAEALAATYASNKNVLLMLYRVRGGASGVIYQYFSNTRATIQFLYWQGLRYAREVSWGNGIVAGAWANITGSERIKGLHFDTSTNELVLVDALTGDKWGKANLSPIAEAIASEAVAREFADNILQTDINNAKSANPFFDKIVSGQTTIELMGTGVYDSIVYLEGNGCFAAYNMSTKKYYNTWPAIGKYSDQKSYGDGSYAVPIIGKIYIMGKTLCVWDGSTFDKTIITEEIARVVANAPEDFDTLKEIADYIASDKTKAAQIVTDISNLKKDKVDHTDHATKLTAGFADNLVGRGEATPETISFRQTAGNTSIEDGTARIVKIRGNTEVVGENLISTNISAIKTVGLNSWDEKWTINPAQGSVYSNVYVPVISGKKYFFSSTREGIDNFYVSVRLYDKNKQKIGDVPNGIYFNTSKNNTNYQNPYEIPADVAYIAFNITPAYGEEYKNDICIHLEHTGYKNGTYEPYKEFIRPIPIADIKDSNGAQLFPEGLCSIGENVYDEITPTKAIKRVGVVDLGDLTWEESGTKDDGLNKPLMLSQNFTGAVFPETANVKANILCAKYQTYTATQVYNQNVGVGLGGETDFPHLYLYDPNFTDAATFKSAMRGVKMYFQLAEPIEVKFDEPLNLDYQVWDFGTESVISDVATAPLKADIIYQFNAVDRIRENSKNTSRPQEAGTVVNESDKRFVYKGERVASNKTSIDVVADVNIQTAANAVQIVTKSWGESSWNVRAIIKPATSGAAGVMSNVQCQSLEELGSFLSKLKTAFGTTDLDTIVSKLATLK